MALRAMGRTHFPEKCVLPLRVPSCPIGFLDGVYLSLSGFAAPSKAQLFDFSDRGGDKAVSGIRLEMISAAFVAKLGIFFL